MSKCLKKVLLCSTQLSGERELTVCVACEEASGAPLFLSPELGIHKGHQEHSGRASVRVRETPFRCGSIQWKCHAVCLALYHSFGKKRETETPSFFYISTSLHLISQTCCVSGTSSGINSSDLWEL